MLEAAGLGDRQHALGEALAGVGLAAERDLAVDDRAAQPAFGGVVGRLDAVDLGERPQGGPELEQVAREDGNLAVLGALARGALEQPAQPTPERRDLPGEPIAVAVLCALAPGREESATDLKPGLAEAPLVGETLGVAAEVAQQMRPADLAARRVEAVVGPPA